MHDLGLREYLHILRRRKWIVFLAVVIVPLAAVALAMRQSPLYQSSADVLLRYQSLPSTLSGINDPNSYSYYVDPVRSTDTQLQIAELPLLTNRVAAALRNEKVTPGEVAGSTGVAEVGDTDVLRFTSTSGSPTVAARLASAYAAQYTRYHQQLDTGSITTAIGGLQRRINELKAAGGRQARTQAAQLQAKIDQLQTLLTLQTSSAVVVRDASGATKIRPRPRKYALLGLALGLVLGIGLALLRDVFDSRLRTTEQLGAALKLALLGRIPAPSRTLERDGRLVMIAEPTSRGADAYRRLRMNLEFATVGKPSQVIMFTSALPREGKSTTVANLAVAMALAGKTVALVDLDLHKPALGGFFRLENNQPGLTSVVLGHTSLEQALVSIPLDPLSRNAGDTIMTRANGQGSASGRGGDSRSAATGSLLLLPTGILPPDPGEFVGLDGVERVIAALREQAQFILLDVPPLLAVGDALTIARSADAVTAIVRFQHARRSTVEEMGAILARMPAHGLGYVLCGVEAATENAAYGYGYGYGYGSRPAAGKSERGGGVPV